MESKKYMIIFDVECPSQKWYNFLDKVNKIFQVELYGQAGNDGEIQDLSYNEVMLLKTQIKSASNNCKLTIIERE